MQGAFESWIGQEVVVQVALGQIRVRLRGMLLKERTGTLLMRPAVGSDIEIPKTTVLAIEELVRMPQYPRWLNPSDAPWSVQHSLFWHSAQDGRLLADILNRESAARRLPQQWVRAIEKSASVMNKADANTSRIDPK